MFNLDYKKFIDPNDVIVQIGAYNGVECEESYGLRELILNSKHECHLIEPLPDAFKSLKENYKNSINYIKFYNLAIYDTDGEKDFYFNSQIPVESSFVRHTDCPSITVKTQKLSTFFNKNNITKVDGLFLDVEGVEDSIIHQLFEDTDIRPKVIRYEFPHLKDNESLEKYISKQNYVIMQCMFGAGDKICIRNDILEALKEEK
jgi:FkbM family methyltransferase